MYSEYKRDMKLRQRSKRRLSVMSDEKTGPEAGQYFDVRPPIGLIRMGYKTKEE